MRRSLPASLSVVFAFASLAPASAAAFSLRDRSEQLGIAFEPASDTTRGVVSGRVTDSVGAALHRATVTLERANPAWRREVTVGRKGTFEFRDVPSGGPYTLTAQYLGYQPFVRSGITVDAVAPVSVAAELIEPGSIVATDALAKSGSPQTRPYITRGEIERRPSQNAFTVLQTLRSELLKEICDSDRGSRLMDRGSDSCGSRKASDVTGLGRTSKGCESPRKVFVDGIRVDLPRQAIDETLQSIPADDIEELRYVDCRDRVVPAEHRDAIWIRTRAAKQ